MGLIAALIYAGIRLTGQTDTPYDWAVFVVALAIGLNEQIRFVMGKIRALRS